MIRRSFHRFHNATDGDQRVPVYAISPHDRGSGYGRRRSDDLRFNVSNDPIAASRSSRGSGDMLGYVSTARAGDQVEDVAPETLVRALG